MSAVGPFDTFLHRVTSTYVMVLTATFFGLICFHLMLQGNTVKYLTPNSVIEYIQQHKLYR